MTTTPTPASVAAALADFRQASPLVSCLTNIVVAQWTANVLLSAGANPAMIDNPHEASGFAEIASGVLVNLGTPYDDTAAAMRAAVGGAAAARTPWVLDPVGVGALPWRTGLARDLIAASSPAIIRGNASEISGLTGGVGGRGVDTATTSDAVVDIARELANTRNTVVAVSGEVDQITDGQRLIRVHNGDPIMTRVTGVGCSLGALMAGFAASVDDPLLAAAAATALLTVAAESAVAATAGPGSFAVALLDALAAVSPDELESKVRLS